MKKSFVLYNDQYEAVEDLTDEQKGQLLDAMFLYSRGEKLKDFDPIVKMAFKFFKIVFDRDCEKWKAVADRNKKNGKKGGRPKSNKNNNIDKNPEEPREPSGFIENPENPEEPRKPVSGSVSGSVNESVIKDISVPLKDGDFFIPDNDYYSLLKSTYKNIDTDQEFKNIISWCVSNPSNKKTKRGVKKFINGWMNRSNEKNKPQDNFAFLRD